jgi:IclR family transcriptional regulator, pca regulon regulatory protein
MATTTLPKQDHQLPAGERLDSERPGRFSSSLCAGLALLSCFSPERPVRGIADMADELGLGRSTTHRYATTLTVLGYLEQGSSRKYRLAPRVADFGLALLDSMSLRQHAREGLMDLRAKSGGTVGLAILDDGEVSYIDRLQSHRRGQHAIDLGYGIGSRLPLHNTAVGKVLLASLPEAELRELVGGLQLARGGGPNSITTKKALLAELEQVREDGWAVEDEELSVGRRSIAALVPGGQGELKAAVDVVIPAEAISRAALVDRVGPAVRDIAARIAAASRG